MGVGLPVPAITRSHRAFHDRGAPVRRRASNPSARRSAMCRSRSPPSYYRTSRRPPVGRLSRRPTRLPEARWSCSRATGAESGFGLPRSSRRVVPHLPGARPRRARRVRRGRRSRTGSLRIAEAVDHPFSVIDAWLGLAYLHECQGRAGSGRRPARARGRSLSGSWNFTILCRSSWRRWDTRTRGRDASGRVVSSLQQAATAYETAGIGWLQSMSVVQLGEAYLLAEQLEDARATADRAITLARAARRARPRGVGAPPPRRDCRRILAVPT